MTELGNGLTGPDQFSKCVREKRDHSKKIMTRSLISDRRQFLGAATLAGLGVALPPTFASGAGSRLANRGTIRSCILIFYYGGPSHLDTFDPKPNGPPRYAVSIARFPRPFPAFAFANTCR
jgi:Protein of unknown function (DUF1501)